jgi:hypothetical protein
MADRPGAPTTAAEAEKYIFPPRTRRGQTGSPSSAAPGPRPPRRRRNPSRRRARTAMRKMEARFRCERDACVRTSAAARAPGRTGRNPVSGTRTLTTPPALMILSRPWGVQALLTRPRRSFGAGTWQRRSGGMMTRMARSSTALTNSIDNVDYWDRQRVSYASSSGLTSVSLGLLGHPVFTSEAEHDHKGCSQRQLLLP